MWRKNFIYCYTYANNNPMRFTDPTGYDGFDDVYLGPGMQTWNGINPEQDGPGGGSGSGGGGGGDGTGVYYNWTDHAYEDANGNFVGWDWVYASFVLPYANTIITPMPGKTINYLNIADNRITVGLIYPESWSSVIINGQHVGMEMISVSFNNVLQPVGEDGRGGFAHSTQTNIGFKVNNAIANTITLTSGSVYGAQRLGGIAAREITEIGFLKIADRVTGVINSYYNINQFLQNPRANWWNGVEGFGQLAAIVVGYATGYEEVELVYNATTLTIDMTHDIIKKYNEDHP